MNQLTKKPFNQQNCQSIVSGKSHWLRMPTDLLASHFNQKCLHFSATLNIAQKSKRSWKVCS
jgi:hypothetical protein